MRTLIAAALMAVLYLLPLQMQAQIQPSKPLTPEKKDSLMQAYRLVRRHLSEIRRQLGRVNRLDEFTDQKARPIRFNILKVDVPNWAFGEPNLGYERKLGRHGTVLLHGAYFARTYRREADTVGSDGLFGSLLHSAFYPAQKAFQRYETRSSSFKIVPEARLYLGRNAPRGFYLGAYYFISGIQWDVTAHSTDTLGHTIVSHGKSSLFMHGPGLVWGFQSIIRSRVSLGFEMGGAYNLGNRIGTWSPLDPKPQNGVEGNTPFLIGALIQMRLNCQVGYCFGR